MHRKPKHNGRSTTSPAAPPMTQARWAAIHREAVACAQRRDFATAKRLCAQMLAARPDDVDALQLAGVIALETRNFASAADLLNRAIVLDPANASAHCNLGSAFEALEDVDAALASFNQAIVADPRFAEAYYNRGIVLRRLGHDEAALASFDRAVALQAGFADAYFNRGLVLEALKRFEGALGDFRSASAFNPKHVQAWLRSALVLRELGRPEAALECVERAIAVQPDLPEAHCYRGNLLTETNDYTAALESFERAIALRPRYAEAHCNHAVALLSLGRYPEGWAEFEWRHELRGGLRGDVSTLSADIAAGRRILVRSEQGLGDTLQFCRYLAVLCDRGAHVIFESPSTLIRLLRSMSAPVEWLVQGVEPPPFDVEVPLLTLPYVLATTLDTIPAPDRYLRAARDDVERWQGRMGHGSGLRVGLTWRGSTVRNNNRSIPLAALIEALPAGAEYVSLQKEPSTADRELLAANPQIQDFSADLLDFADTAALCECMDVVVSIDTSVAHLAAALGVDTWVLLPFNADWRWLVDRKDSPWYPTATLYRQPLREAWGAVLERVARDLRERIGAV